MIKVKRDDFMRKQSRLTFFFSLLGFLPLILPCGLFADDVSVTIYHTTDLHDKSLHIPRIAHMVAEKKKTGPNVLFMDTGDWMNKGDLTPLNTRGEAIVSLMGACKYDAVIMGNHDYSFGTKRLLELKDRYALPILAANITWEDEQFSDAIPPYKIFKLKGIDVAVVGLASHYQNHRTDHEIKTHFDVESIGKILESVNAQSDIIVLMTHVGGKVDKELMQKLPQADLILGGHDHAVYHEMVYDETVKTVLHHSGTQGRHLGEIIFTWDGSKIIDRKARCIEITPDMQGDPQIEKMISELKKTID